MISMTTTWNLTTVNIVLCAVRCKNKIKQKLTFLDRPFRNSSIFFKTICWFENRNFCCFFSKWFKMVCSLTFWVCDINFKTANWIHMCLFIMFSKIAWGKNRDVVSKMNSRKTGITNTHPLKSAIPSMSANTVFIVTLSKYSKYENFVTLLAYARQNTK